MSFASFHKRITYFYAALGLLVLARGAELSPRSSALLAIGFIATWFAEPPRIDTPYWPRLLTTFVFVTFGLQIARFLLGADLLPLALEFVGGLQLTRLAARRTSTEYLHIIGLGLTHLIAGTLLTTGIDYALIFLGFLFVTPPMLALTHLRAELEREHATKEELALGTPPRLARLLDSPHVARRTFLFLSSALIVPLFAITSTFFVFVPRVGLGIFTFGSTTSESTAGFGSTVDLGRFGLIRDDPTVVVRVFAPAPTQGEQARFRLRGTSFDRFDGTRWSRTEHRGELRKDAYGALILFPDARIPRASTSLRLVATPLDGGVFFLPEGARTLRVAPRFSSGLTVARSVREKPGADFRVAEEDGLNLDYVVTIDPSASDVPETIDDAMRAELLRIPEGHERLRELARELARDASSEGEIAMRFEAFLSSEGGFTYTLETPRVEGQRPIEHFLFESKRGHCELFASAMALMLRARGVPARNVTGFLGGRWNAYGGYYTLAQGDAHSWVEAEIDGSFRRFDPTPAARAAAAPKRSFLDPMRELLDAMKMRWARDVVGYDMERQLEFFRAFRGLFRSEGGGSRFVRDEAADASSSGRGDVSGVLPFIGFALAAALVYALFRFARGWLRKEKADPATAVYRALESELRRHELERPLSRTPLEHLETIRSSGFEAVDAVEEITRAYVESRYRGAPFDGSAKLERALERVRRAPTPTRQTHSSDKRPNS